MESRNKLLKKVMIVISVVLVLVLAVQALQKNKVAEISKEDDIGTKNDLSGSAPEVVSDQGEFTLIHVSVEGDVFKEASSLSSDEKEKVNAAIMDYMIRSAAWDAIPVEEMGEHYIIIQRGTDNTEEKYFLFKLDDKYVLQWEKARRWSYITDISYINIEEVLKSHEE